MSAPLPSSALSPSQSHDIVCDPAFEWMGSHYIASLDVTVQHFQHKVTQAHHIHLANDDDHQAFMVAFRTLPMDDTGVAHILEHTVLCGSRRYPVRDPFFMMIRRSLNTFMNAFTSSDWTAYPFATQNDKDFDNLLNVYLDASFFPNLQATDFWQEGHRLEFEQADDITSPLTFKGVVFNEMKGAMSSPNAILWQSLSKHLFDDTTYHYNSGGEPEAILDLTHEQLVDFHRKHYHPSNAVFFTYGKRSAASLQATFEANVLSQFDEASTPVWNQSQPSWHTPKKVQESYPMNEADLSQKTHFVISWKLPKNTELLDVLRAELLSAVLLDNSASPMRYCLETLDHAQAPSPMCGVGSDLYDMIFTLGVQGTDAEHVDEIEHIVLSELERLSVEGVDPQQLAAMLHQLELSQREIGGDGYPFGLQLSLNLISAALNQGDVLNALDLDVALAQLRDEIDDPNFISHLIKNWLTENPHRLSLTLVPSATLSEEKQQAEQQKLRHLEASLSDAQKQKIVQQTQQLAARQAEEDDVNILPCVTKADIPPHISEPEGQNQAILTSGNQTLTVRQYQTRTNGLVYQRLVCDLPALSEEEQFALPYFSRMLDELGSNGRDYLQTQMAQASLVGSIGAYSQFQSDMQDVQHTTARFIVDGSALNRNHTGLNELMQDTLLKVRFDETSRIKELFQQIKASAKRGVISNGHGYAMGASAQQQTPLAQWQFNQSGLRGIQQFDRWSDDLSDAKLEAISETFARLQQKLQQAPKQALLIHDGGYDQALNQLSQDWKSLPDSQASHGAFVMPSWQRKTPLNQAWLTNAEVNYCALTLPAVGPLHPDAPALSVLSAMLRNGYLHTAIREQGGAYGGGARFNADLAAFSFFSYRDPRLADTFADFEQSKAWALNEASDIFVNEAILNVIAAIDKPGSPAGEAKSAFNRYLRGYDMDTRQAKRQSIVNVTLADVQRVAETYLDFEQADKAVVAPFAAESTLLDLGFEPETL